MFEFFRKQLAKTALNRTWQEVVKEGTPADLTLNSRALYFVSLMEAKHLYMHIFFGSHKVLSDSTAGRKDKEIFATLIAALYSSWAPTFEIDVEQIAIAMQKHFNDINEIWHDQIFQTIDALCDYKTDTQKKVLELLQLENPLKKDVEVLKLIKLVSRRSSNINVEITTIEEFKFHLWYESYTLSAYKNFYAMRSMLEKNP